MKSAVQIQIDMVNLQAAIDFGIGDPQVLQRRLDEAREDYLHAIAAQERGVRCCRSQACGECADCECAATELRGLQSMLRSELALVERLQRRHERLTGQRFVREVTL